MSNTVGSAEDLLQMHEAVAKTQRAEAQITLLLRCSFPPVLCLGCLVWVVLWSRQWLGPGPTAS